MENIRLSWDLFVLVFFGVVIAYSFIIGRNQTIKIIIASYMAILTADGLGNLFETYVLPTAPSLQGEAGLQVLVLLKIFVFVLTIVLLAIRGGFRVDLGLENSVVTRILANLSFGFLNAGLMVSTLLVYLTGGSFVMGTVQTGLSINLYAQSEFIQTIIDHYDVWFALPALAIVLVSFFQPQEE
ncbi:hypothetical protein IPG41_05645 [Candidatus Peregrinibacteria bacterium]|nr:MAG: hypothetical protein IPG41_05645 [Candidatus Peregrinibacteria bacterium]